MDGFFADLGEAYNKAVAAFGAAGCRYLQLDEVNIAYLCDPEQIAGLKARGEHVENLLQIYAGLLNRAIEARPDCMTVSMHLCRGNFRSHWVALYRVCGFGVPILPVSVFGALDSPGSNTCS